MSHLPPRVFLTRALPAPVMERLERETRLVVHRADRAPSREELIAGAAGADALLCNLADRVDAALLAAAPGLRVIANYGVGVNHIDLAAASAAGVWVTNTPGVLTEATADTAFGLLLAAARRFHEGETLVRSGAWTGWEPLQLIGRDLHGATLAIVGMGRIGQAMARRARGFGLKIVYWNRTRLAPEKELELAVAYVGRDEIWGAADFYSLHCAYGPETHHLVDRAALASMRPHAILVNTARGACVDEKALVEALRAGRIGGAGLDVFEREPALEPGLVDLPNCILLPHIGTAGDKTRLRMGEILLRNLFAALGGGTPPDAVNAPLVAAVRP